MAAYLNSNWQLLPQSSDNEAEGPSPKNTWVLTKLPDMNRAWRKQDSAFLNLPAEIRDTIYSMVLREKKRWNIRHIGDCPVRDQAGFPEDIPWKSDPRTCTCIRSHRKGLSLLLTCRQVHYEATPEFFRGNVMCFNLQRRGESALLALESAPSMIIQNIRHLSILGTRRTHADKEIRITIDMWQVIINCTHLETLEMCYENLEWLGADLINQLCSLASFRRLRVISIIGEVIRGIPILFLLPTDVPLPLDETSLWDVYFSFRDHTTDCAATIEREVWNFVEAVKCSRKVDPPTHMRLEPLPGTTQWVRVFGAPNTSLTRSRLHQAEWKGKQDERTADALEEERLRRLRLKEKKKEQEFSEQIDQEIAKREERETRIEQLKKMDKADERKSKKKMAKNVRKQQELRLQERKRPAGQSKDKS